MADVNAAADAAAPSSSQSWPKRLHKRLLKALTKGSATNCDMTLFRYLYDGPDDDAASKTATAGAVLCALAPVRAATLVLPVQRRLARRVIEHKKVGAPGVVNFVVARQRWFDAQMKQATAQGSGVEQVVALAAGYELRAHRCRSSGNASSASPSTPPLAFFEVDLPHASLKKQEFVKKLKLEDGHVRYVACDLGVPGQLKAKLEAAGFDATKATLFTAEGLIYYLPGAAAAALVREVGEMVAATPGSKLALDYLHSDALEAGLAAGIGAEGAAAGGDDDDKTTKKTKKEKKKEKKKNKAAGIKMPRAYEVTARSVAAKGEPFLSGFGASALDAATWLAAASGGALSLCAHTTTRTACDELLGPEAAEKHGILGFYSFLVAEGAGPLPPSAPGGAAVVAAADVVARVVV